MQVINYGAAAGATALRTATADANRSVGDLASGKTADLGISVVHNSRANSYGQGAKNLTIQAGRYEAYAGAFNAVVSTTQAMIELATKYGSTGYHTSEYMAAGARLNALDALRTQQLADTAMNPIALALNVVKTEDMAAGFTGVTATKIGRAIAARAAADTVVVGGNFALAAALTQANGDTAGELAALTTQLNTELQSAAAEAATMSAAAKMLNDASTATGFRAAGYSAGASASGVDFGKETAALAAAQIRAQAATAMIAQSSVIDQSALALMQ